MATHDTLMQVAEAHPGDEGVAFIAGQAVLPGGKGLLVATSLRRGGVANVHLVSEVCVAGTSLEVDVPVRVLDHDTRTWILTDENNDQRTYVDWGARTQEITPFAGLAADAINSAELVVATAERSELLQWVMNAISPEATLVVNACGPLQMILNADPHLLGSLLARADVLVVNETELISLLVGDFGQEPLELPFDAVITNGSHGGRFYSRTQGWGKYEAVPLPGDAPRMSVGAGDSFLGFLVNSLLMGLPLREACTAAAGSTTETLRQLHESLG